MSIRKNIQVLLIFLVGIPMLLLLYESYRSARNTALSQMKVGALSIAELQTSELDGLFNGPRLIAKGLARGINSAQPLTGQEIEKLLTLTLQQSPEIFGTAVAMHTGRGHLGRFAAYCYRKNDIPTIRHLNSPGYDYTTKDWYRSVMADGRAHWSRPYFDEGGGDELMITYSVPLRRGGEVVGVVTVDVDLDSLVAHLRKVRPGGDGTAYLVNYEGVVIAHPRLKPMAEIQDNPSLAGLRKLLEHPGVDTIQMTDPVERTDSWVVETPIPMLSPERGGQGWSLVVSWPLGTHLTPLTDMGRRMLVLFVFLGGAALLILNRSFDRQITRPLRRLSAQARAYAEGDVDSVPPGRVESTQELRELSLALNRLGEARLRERKAVSIDKEAQS